MLKYRDFNCACVKFMTSPEIASFFVVLNAYLDSGVEAGGIKLQDILSKEKCVNFKIPMMK